MITDLFSGTPANYSTQEEIVVGPPALAIAQEC